MGAPMAANSNSPGMIPKDFLIIGLL